MAAPASAPGDPGAERALLLAEGGCGAISRCATYIFCSRPAFAAVLPAFSGLRGAFWVQTRHFVAISCHILGVFATGMGQCTEKRQAHGALGPGGARSSGTHHSPVTAATDTTFADVTSTSSRGFTEKTARGVPAAAHTIS